VPLGAFGAPAHDVMAGLLQAIEGAAAASGERQILDDQPEVRRLDLGRRPAVLAGVEVEGDRLLDVAEAALRPGGGDPVPDAGYSPAATPSITANSLGKVFGAKPAFFIMSKRARAALSWTVKSAEDRALWASAAP
jgi:hypothetical protein